MRTLLTLLCLVSPLSAADLIVHNGKIASVDSKFSLHQAMLVRDGRVMRLGTDAEILAEKKAESEVLDLAGRTVLPGLMRRTARGVRVLSVESPASLEAAVAALGSEQSG